MSKRFKLKIRAGETFLYRKGGTESQVFEIRMKSSVNYHCLIKAAKLAYRRFPYFKSRFKVEDGNVYLCENVFSPPPARAKKLRPLDGLGSYEKKQVLVSSFTSKPINSFICSYTGRADMGDAEKYIESMHAYSSGTKGVSLQMMSVGDTFSVDFLQNFPDRLYVDAFLIEAAKLGLKAECSGMIPFTTPKDHSSNTNFVKSLIAFFNKKR